MRNAFRPLSQGVSHGRSIHIPSGALGRKLPPLPGGASSGKAKGVIDTARSALTRLLYGTQPISHSTQPHAFRRAIHTVQPVRNQFSFPVRHALSTSPLSFARPPVVQRGMSEVGLGTARKFSTARPIFQHLAQNVPVAGRSMYEMDLDLQKKKGRRLGSKRTGENKGSGKPLEKTKAKQSSFEENFDRYFPVDPSECHEVSATVVVPLSPSEVSAFSQFPPKASKGRNFIPFEEMWNTFQTHGKHSLQVSALFRKLDQAKVWDRGAHYEAFGPSFSSIDRIPAQSALCTRLKIVFDGWTAEMVKDVIGETGEGWCTLQETRIPVPEVRPGPYSVESSRAGTPPPPEMASSSINAWDEHTEFIMPTMDFSSSFLDHTAVPPLPESPPPFFEDTILSGSGASTPWMSDLSLPSTRAGSVFGDVEMDDEWLSASGSRGSSRPSERNEGNIAFSADFMRRSQQFDVWSNF